LSFYATENSEREFYLDGFFWGSLFQDGGFLFGWFYRWFLGGFCLCSCFFGGRIYMLRQPFVFYHLFPIFYDSSSKSLCHRQTCRLRLLFHRMSLLFNCCCFFGMLYGDRKARVNLESFSWSSVVVRIQARRQQQERPDGPCLRNHCNTCCC